MNRFNNKISARPDKNYGNATDYDPLESLNETEYDNLETEFLNKLSLSENQIKSLKNHIKHQCDEWAFSEKSDKLKI